MSARRPVANTASASPRGSSGSASGGDVVATLATSAVADSPPDSPIADVPLVRSLLLEWAQAGESISYSRFLNRLGLPFSRPKMRALCRTLDRIDQDGEARGEPGLAVLVVRESDGLPGQGWWAGWRSEQLPSLGDWTGPAARAFVREHQQAAFDYWRER
jgi:hypothetical protein